MKGIDIAQIERERDKLKEQYDAAEQLLESAKQFKKLNGAPAPAKAPKPKAKKRKTPSKAPCPDCGNLHVQGAGMAAHRKEAHGWRKGMPLDQPVPRARFE